MIRRPPRSTRTDTLFPYTTLFRSLGALPVRIFVADGIHDDLAQPRCHGANLRLSPVGKVLARLEQPFAHLLAREIASGSSVKNAGPWLNPFRRNPRGLHGPRNPAVEVYVGLVSDLFDFHRR